MQHGCYMIVCFYFALLLLLLLPSTGVLFLLLTMVALFPISSFFYSKMSK